MAPRRLAVQAERALRSRSHPNLRADFDGNDGLSPLGQFVQAFLKYVERLRSSPAHQALVDELARTLREPDPCTLDSSPPFQDAFANSADHLEPKSPEQL
jgi:hypothetical protein